MIPTKPDVKRTIGLLKTNFFAELTGSGLDHETLKIVQAALDEAIRNVMFVWNESEGRG